MDYKITYSPNQSDLAAIESWLQWEEDELGTGFLCNWASILNLSKNDKLIIISKNDAPIGFLGFIVNDPMPTAEIQILEIHPKHRKKGIGKLFVNSVLEHLKQNGTEAINLQCAPESSEAFWKKMGFLDYPDKRETYQSYPSGANKKLYKIIVDHLEVDSVPDADEKLELWNMEPNFALGKPSKYSWGIDYRRNSPELRNPIIFPANYEWKIE
jgi:GNAT superfamily N-acetyltransferase